MEYQAYLKQWPSPCPELTEMEAKKAAKKLFRKLTGKPWGRRQLKFSNGGTYRSPTVLELNIKHGWPWMIWIVAKLGTKAPYDFSFKASELAKFVIDSDWLSGTLRRIKKEKPKPLMEEVRYNLVVKQISRWESKQRRAERALKKLYPRRQRYERTLAQKRTSMSAAEFILNSRGEGL